MTMTMTMTLAKRWSMIIEAINLNERRRSITIDSSYRWARLANARGVWSRKTSVRCLSGRSSVLINHRKSRHAVYRLLLTDPLSADQPFVFSSEFGLFVRFRLDNVPPCPIHTADATQLNSTVASRRRYVLGLRYNSSRKRAPISSKFLTRTFWPHG